MRQSQVLLFEDLEAKSLGGLTSASLLGISVLQSGQTTAAHKQHA